MEALHSGYLVRYTTLDDIVRELRQADQFGMLRNKLAHYQRPHLIVDELGYPNVRELAVTPEEHGDLGHPP